MFVLTLTYCLRLFMSNHSTATSPESSESLSNLYDESTEKYISKGKWLMANEIPFHKGES